MSVNLDFLNKNTLRKYPLRGGTSGLFANGETFPRWLLSSISISVPEAYQDLYVSKVVYSQSILSVTIREYNTEVLIGYFQTVNPKNYQVLPLVAAESISTVSGTLTLGELSGLNTLLGAYEVTKFDGLIEDSCIFIYTPPAVVSISNEGDVTKGHITVLGDNIRITTAAQNLALAVLDVSAVSSNNDYHGKLSNCPTRVIKSINTVLPDVNGNIDIYTIEPLAITVTAGEIGLVTDLTISDVCPAKNVLSPPVDETDVYYTDFLTAETPEWRTWPRFE